MFKKIIAATICLAIFLPAVSFAKIDWGVNVGGSGNGWSFNLGTGSGGNSGSGGSGGSGGGWSGAMSRLSGTGLPQGSILGIIENIMNWLLAILGIAGVIGFAIAGIIYMVSAGDETAVERAKTAMKWSIVGVVVGLSGLVAIRAINAMLGANPNF